MARHGAGWINSIMQLTQCFLLRIFFLLGPFSLKYLNMSLLLNLIPIKRIFWNFVTFSSITFFYCLWFSPLEGSQMTQHDRNQGKLKKKGFQKNKGQISHPSESLTSLIQFATHSQKFRKLSKSSYQTGFFFFLNISLASISHYLITLSEI